MLALPMVGLEPVQLKINVLKNPNTEINLKMNKIRKFVNSPDGELILGTIGMVAFFIVFYKVMWIASAVGLLN